jgi:quercetin dioxygenase-like cupin family protein
MDMKTVNAETLSAEIVREPGARGATIRRLIDTPDGADRFVMSLFELAPNGSTPPHYHDWEHEIFILSGQLRLELPGETPEKTRSVVLSAGDAAFIPRNEPHGFTTASKDRARFLVIAPTDRPVVRNVFLSDKPWEAEPGAAERGMQ